MRKKSSIIAIIYLAVAQILTLIVEQTLRLGTKVEMIPSFLSWNKVYNTGAAWSLLENNQIMIVGIAIVLSFMVVAYEKDFQENTRNALAFGLLVGGLLSNLLDRLIRGHVVDYIAIQIMQYEYPIFNAADIGIVIGVLLILYAIMKQEDQNGTDRRRKTKNR